MPYNTIINKEAFGEVAHKKSKFIASIAPATTEDEANNYIKNKKKQYHDARHNCSCYIIGKGVLEKSSDDGEPSGTAGRPMLEILKGQELYNVVCVVTRYFGGVLLGTGGLVRAYQDAVREALKGAELLSTFTAEVVEVISDYNNWPKIESLCRSNNYVVEADYGENVKSRIEIPASDLESTIDTIIDSTGGKATINKQGTKEALRRS